MAQKLSTELVKWYGLGASITSIIQSILWTVLCLLSILCYVEVIDVTENSAPLEATMYNLLLNSRWDNFLNKRLVAPTDFFIINIFYVVVSVIWFAESLYLLIIFCQGQWHKSKYCAIAWTIVTTIILISDGVIFGIFCYDLDAASVVENIYIDLSYVIVLFVASRGFVLWIMNLIYVVFFATTLIRDYSNKPKSDFKASRTRNYDSGIPLGEAINEDNVKEVDEQLGCPKSETPARPFSPQLIEKIEQTYASSTLPRISFARQKLLRPLTPPADYSPPRSRKTPYRSISEYEPLKA